MKNNNSQQHTGFSLVELIVIISLFAIMSSVVSFDFQRYQENIDRVNLATDIALAFRQMQVYGISASNREIGAAGFEQDSGTVQGLVSSDLSQDTSVYGVELDLDAQELTLFQEIAGVNNQYNDGTDILIDRLAITGDNTVLRICATAEFTQPMVLGDGSCDIQGDVIEINSGTFTAMFERPFPDGSYAISQDPSFTPSIAIFVVGTPARSAEELNYIYMDAVGLIQSVNVNSVLSS